MRLVLAVATLLVASSGCREEKLAAASGTVELSPTHFDFGSVYSGQSSTIAFKIRNDNRYSIPLTWSLPDGPFSASALPATAKVGLTEVVITFAPRGTGTFGGMISLLPEGFESLQSFVSGTAIDTPNCPRLDGCTQAIFDIAQNKCVEAALPEGSSCQASTACIENGVCVAGRCVGKEKNCDDGNACTIDVCNATLGCEHLPRPPCPGDGKCGVGVCNPVNGCELAPAADGTACGPQQTCDAAEVCIAGDCVVRDPPDGYVCAQASPCQGEGRCAGSVCSRPVPTVLQPSWSYDSVGPVAPDGSSASEELHDFVLEPSGAMSLSGFFRSAPRLRINTPQASQADGPVRRCLLWGNRYICADYPAEVNGKVSALSLTTAETVWTFDLRTARPDLNAMTQSLFMARMAVMGSDRLAALFEAYPKTGSGATTTQCRRYFLVVLNAQGELISASPVVDPVLDECNHPHPYGFGADAMGNLYISFSPTITQPAPLVPGSPTMVMSYTKDGVFRWKFIDHDLKGGELAVAGGLLYPENSPMAVLSSTGKPAFALDEAYGRAVITRERTVVAPRVGSVSVNGYESGLNTKRWQHLLKGGQYFASDQLRLAQWSTRTGPRSVALTFVGDLVSNDYQLHAIDTRDGSEAFSCQISSPFRTPPQMFEVGTGMMGLMEGSDTCGKCDPPFASSSAAFHTFSLPLLDLAKEPWVGAFGGAGHDHREEVLAPQGEPGLH